MSTIALDNASLYTAFGTLVDQLPPATQLHNDNQEQGIFLYLLHCLRDGGMKLPDLGAIASPDYQALNNYLAGAGFDLRFEPIPDGGIGVASVLDIQVSWPLTGTRTMLHADHHWWAAFQLDTGVRQYHLQDFGRPLLGLPTQTGHTVWIMEHPQPSSSWELGQIVQVIADTQASRDEVSSTPVRIPLVRSDCTADLNWLLGLKAVVPSGPPHRVAQAFQSVRWGMDEKGARVEAGTGVATVRESTLVSTDITSPFILFMTAPDTPRLPIGTTWVDMDSWSDPQRTV